VRLPDTDPRLHSTYSAAGFNVNVPILNGSLYAARRSEAELRAAGSRKRRRGSGRAGCRAGAGGVARSNTAFRRFDVTARLVAKRAGFAAGADAL
jgi:outer membrane protein